jgi:UPF0716 family protein affecting phage T7 exclusion
LTLLFLLLVFLAGVLLVRRGGLSFATATLENAKQAAIISAKNLITSSKLRPRRADLN